MGHSLEQPRRQTKTGQVTTPLDLRLELGARYLFDNLGRMGFVDGYRHTFSPSEASTQVSLTRVLPLGVYQNEYRRTLGRKRDDEPLAPKFLVEGNYGETQVAGER